MTLSDTQAMISGRPVDKSPTVDEKPSDRDAELIDFFQKAPIALHWLSGTGQVIWANDMELNLLGYSADEYIGHSIMEVRYLP